MPDNSSITAIVFDAYGTLFDVYAIGAQAEDIFPGQGAALAEIWRVAQIDYSRIRALSNRYRDFWALTGDALDFAAARLKLDLTAAKRQHLLDQYAELTAFPENLNVLRQLKADGHRLAILSNGTPMMLDSAVDAAGMKGLFDHVLSVEAVKTFKTAPEAYQMAPDIFGCPVSEIVFVSSNSWDACGATWFGFRTFWINRAETVIDQLGVAPHGEGRNLNDLPGFVAGLGGI